MISAWWRGHVGLTRDEVAPNRTPSLLVDHHARCAKDGERKSVRMAQRLGRTKIAEFK